MITHELISQEWEKDYPKPKEIRKNLENLAEITLTFENKYNKYWDFYSQAESQLHRKKAQHRKLESVLKRYFSKKHVSDAEIEYFNLEPLNTSFTKTEIDLMVKSHDKYSESEMSIKSMESLLERIKECIKFISSWKFNQKDFIGMYRLVNGYVKE